MNEKELKELSIEDIETHLKKSSLGSLKNEFRKLGLKLPKVQHEKKTDLIKRALVALVELRQAIDKEDTHTLDETGVEPIGESVRPIKTQKQ
jgi:hypothetical protein